MEGAHRNENAAMCERQEQAMRHQHAAILDELPREHGVMTSQFGISSGDAGIDAREGTEVAMEPRVDRRLPLGLERRQVCNCMLENRDLGRQRNPVEGGDLFVEIFQSENGHASLARSEVEAAVESRPVARGQNSIDPQQLFLWLRPGPHPLGWRGRTQHVAKSSMGLLSEEGSEPTPVVELRSL